MRDLDGDRRAIEHDDLMAPGELVGFTRSKAQRNVRYGRRLPVRLAPSPGVTPHGIVAAFVTAAAHPMRSPAGRTGGVSQCDLT